MRSTGHFPNLSTVPHESKSSGNNLWPKAIQTVTAPLILLLVSSPIFSPRNVCFKPSSVKRGWLLVWALHKQLLSNLLCKGFICARQASPTDAWGVGTRNSRLIVDHSSYFKSALFSPVLPNNQSSIILVRAASDTFEPLVTRPLACPLWKVVVSTRCNWTLRTKEILKWSFFPLWECLAWHRVPRYVFSFLWILECGDILSSGQIDLVYNCALNEEIFISKWPKLN